MDAQVKGKVMKNVAKEALTMPKEDPKNEPAVQEAKPQTVADGTKKE